MPLTQALALADKDEVLVETIVNDDEDDGVNDEVEIALEGTDDEMEGLETDVAAVVPTVILNGAVNTSTVPGRVPEGSAIVDVTGPVNVFEPEYATDMVTNTPAAEVDIVVEVLVDEDVAEDVKLEDEMPAPDEDDIAPILEVGVPVGLELVDTADTSTVVVVAVDDVVLVTDVIEVPAVLEGVVSSPVRE